MTGRGESKEVLVDAKTAARVLGKMGIVVSPETMGNHWRAGRIRGYKPLKQVLFYISELVEDYFSPPPAKNKRGES